MTAGLICIPTVNCGYAALSKSSSSFSAKTSLALRPVWANRRLWLLNGVVDYLAKLALNIVRSAVIMIEVSPRNSAYMSVWMQDMEDHMMMDAEERVDTIQDADAGAASAGTTLGEFRKWLVGKLQDGRGEVVICDAEVPRFVRIVDALWAVIELTCADFAHVRRQQDPGAAWIESARV
jgi:hypothetical protein